MVAIMVCIRAACKAARDGARAYLLRGEAAHADANGGGTISWITAADNTTAQSVYDKLANRQTWVTYEMGS